MPFITLFVWQGWCKRWVSLRAALDLNDLWGSLQPIDAMIVWEYTCALNSKGGFSTWAFGTRQWLRDCWQCSKFWFLQLLFILKFTYKLLSDFFLLLFLHIHTASFLNPKLLLFDYKQFWIFIGYFIKWNKYIPNRGEYTSEWTTREYFINLLLSLCNHVH